MPIPEAQKKEIGMDLDAVNPLFTSICEQPPSYMFQLFESDIEVTLVNPQIIMGHGGLLGTHNLSQIVHDGHVPFADWGIDIHESEQGERVYSLSNRSDVSVTIAADQISIYERMYGDTLVGALMAATEVTFSQARENGLVIADMESSLRPYPFNNRLDIECIFLPGSVCRTLGMGVMQDDALYMVPPLWVRDHPELLNDLARENVHPASVILSLFDFDTRVQKSWR